MFLPIKDFEKKRKDSYQFSAITMDSTGEEGGVEFLSQQMFSNYNGFFLRSSMFFFFFFSPLNTLYVQNQSPVESADY